MRRLDPQHRHPVAVVPGGELAFLVEADLAELGQSGRFELEQVEHDPLQAREVFGRMILARRPQGVAASV